MFHFSRRSLFCLLLFVGLIVCINVTLIFAKEVKSGFEPPQTPTDNNGFNTDLYCTGEGCADNPGGSYDSGNSYIPSTSPPQKSPQEKEKDEIDAAIRFGGDVTVRYSHKITLPSGAVLELKPGDSISSGYAGISSTGTLTIGDITAENFAGYRMIDGVNHFDYVALLKSGDRTVINAQDVEKTADRITVGEGELVLNGGKLITKSQSIVYTGGKTFVIGAKTADISKSGSITYSGHSATVLESSAIAIKGNK